MRNSKIEKLKAVSLRDWYSVTFPDDEYGMKLNQITLYDVWHTLTTGRFSYKTLGKYADTLIRERVFSEIATQLGVKYSTIYDMWINMPAV